MASVGFNFNFLKSFFSRDHKDTNQHCFPRVYLQLRVLSYEAKLEVFKLWSSNRDQTFNHAFTVTQIESELHVYQGKSSFNETKV